MEFDPRMTDETKAFIVSFSKLAPQIFGDVNVARQLLDAHADKLNAATQYFDVVESEHFVDSLYDEYKIPITTIVPKSATPSSPIVVFFHGGGFKLFSRKTHRNAAVFLSHYSNTIWVSVGYRLTPEHKHPILVQDCVSATKWVLQNKTSVFKTLPDTKVGVCGDSAGGYLAASVALELRDSLAFQILVYPWLDLTLKSESYREFAKPLYLLPDEGFKSVLVELLVDTSLVNTSSVSPILHENLSGLPKCFFLNAELDPLVDDAHTYNKRLNEAGVSSEMYVVKGAVHCFFHAFLEYPNAYIEGATEICKFLKRV